ncbi:hypothetical protein ACU610_00405 [Geodermatophilus sp. URMC 61]|uniref:hypothetical protein n=1 Tax=Geodermatophilus sp. URMC 61 TaxID=3423411 RepID=UPI00406CE24B
MTNATGNGRGDEQLALALRQFLAYPVRTTPGAPLREREERGTGDLKDAVEDAIGDVLGWRRKPGRIEGVLAALEQAFLPYEKDGRVLYRHQPNIASFHSELEGGVVGAQASLHVRATEALNRALPLLEGLEPLIEDADDEIAAAVKGVIETELRELVQELGRLGGPRVQRVDQLWRVLLGEGEGVLVDPDHVGGQLGRLRDALGLSQNDSNDRVNNVDEEQQLTSFRIITDDLVSLRASWERDAEFFGGTSSSAFLGIRLVQLERRLAVVAGSVGELRTALDAVLIDAEERRTFAVELSGGGNILLEDLLEWVEDFATQEGPRLVKDGGRLAITEVLGSAATELRDLVADARCTAEGGDGLGFSSIAVQEALRALENHLRAVVEAACEEEGGTYVPGAPSGDESGRETSADTAPGGAPPRPRSPGKDNPRKRAPRKASPTGPGSGEQR